MAPAPRALSARAVAAPPSSPFRADPLRPQFRRHVTPEILSRMLGVRHAVVLRWIRSGALPALNITTRRVPRYRIFRPDLVVFLRSRGATEAHASAIADFGRS